MSRGVGKKSIDLLFDSSRAHDRSLWASLQDSAVVGRIRGKGRSAIIDFVERMTTLHQNAQQNAFDHFEAWHASLRTLQILDEQKLEARDEQERQRAENVVRLVTEVKTWLEHNPDEQLGLYLEQTALVSDADAVETDGDTVNIMTVHASKGLEFPVVFVVALEEDVFPHSRAKMEGDVEEERRLFYVAVTRAMDRVYLSRVRMRRTFAELSYQRPSRFLREIDAGSNDAPSVEVEAYVPSSPEQWYDEALLVQPIRSGKVFGTVSMGRNRFRLSKGKTSVVTVRPGGQTKILADFLSPSGDEGQQEW